MRVPSLRRASVSIVVAAALTLTGCAGAAGSTPTPRPSLSALCDDRLVTACRIDDAAASLTIDAHASASDVLDLLRRVHDAIAGENRRGDVSLNQLAPAAMKPDPDMSTPSLWSMTAVPAELADAENRLSQLLAVAAVPGTFGISDTSSGWPHVDVADISRFADVFRVVSALPMFANGGTYRLAAVGNRLRIEHTPSWARSSFIEEVIDIAVDYPHAEVLLEAPAGGGEPPVLYVSHLTATDAATLAQRLNTSASPVSDTAPGVRIPYTLGTVGADGVTSATGTVGDAS